jgi:galactose mutarotase-like enzyme
MTRALRVGGAPVIQLSAPASDRTRPAFVGATVLPGRGMMLLQAKLRLPSGELTDVLSAPEVEEAAELLDGGDQDFAGNQSFSFGGAVLAPFANRIRGEAVRGAREIRTTVAGQPVRLPRNWGGAEPGAEQYAMHGLVLDARARLQQVEAASVVGRLGLDGGPEQWPGRLILEVRWTLHGGALRLLVRAKNRGLAQAPVGLGWHPYFKLPSGDRGQARLHLAARARALVNNYDEVLPTGVIEPVSGAYDFTDPRGRPLEDIYLDDCFTDLDRREGTPLAVLRDDAASLGLRLYSSSPDIRALQVFAPRDAPHVVIEPQFNLADPYGAAWCGRDTGMVILPPGGSTTYEVHVQPFAPPG